LSNIWHLSVTRFFRCLYLMCNKQTWWWRWWWWIADCRAGLTFTINFCASAGFRPELLIVDFENLTLKGLHCKEAVTTCLQIGWSALSYTISVSSRSCKGAIPFKCQPHTCACCHQLQNCLRSSAEAKAYQTVKTCKMWFQRTFN